MFPIQDQISVSTRSYLEAQLAMMASLTNKTLESVEKLVDLNLSTARASMQESSLVAKQIMSARDPQEFLSLSTSQAQPNIEKFLVYGKSLAEIASSTQSEFSRAAETQLSEVNRKVAKIVEDAAKNAPAGSETVVAMVKSAIDNANAGFGQMAKTGKQAVAAMGANINTVAHDVIQGASKANGSAG